MDRINLQPSANAELARARQARLRTSGAPAPVRDGESIHVSMLTMDGRPTQPHGGETAAPRQMTLADQMAVAEARKDAAQEAYVQSLHDQFHGRTAERFAPSLTDRTPPWAKAQASAVADAAGRKASLQDTLDAAQARRDAALDAYRERLSNAWQDGRQEAAAPKPAPERDPMLNLSAHEIERQQTETDLAAIYARAEENRKKALAERDRMISTAWMKHGGS